MQIILSKFHENTKNVNIIIASNKTLRKITVSKLFKYKGIFLSVPVQWLGMQLSGKCLSSKPEELNPQHWKKAFYFKKDKQMIIHDLFSPPNNPKQFHCSTIYLAAVEF